MDDMKWNLPNGDTKVDPSSIIFPLLGRYRIESKKDVGMY